MKKFSTKESFIERANKKHGNKFDYSAVEYIDCETPVLIHCPVHSEFYQTPLNHMRTGCLICNKEIQKEKIISKDFIENAIKTHGLKYDYSKVNYMGNKVKVLLSCNTCGNEFLVKPNNHISNKSGCMVCGTASRGLKRRLTHEQFLENAKLIHGNKYEYLTKYTHSREKIKCLCLECNEEFSATTNSILSGSGCPKCAKYYCGYTNTKWKIAGEKSSYFESYKVYLVKCFNETEVFYKIGKTFNRISNRFRHIPYNWELISEREGSAVYMSELERTLHKECKEFKYTPQIPFKGQFECFLYTPEIQQIFNTLSK